MSGIAIAAAVLAAAVVVALSCSSRACCFAARRIGWRRGSRRVRRNLQAPDARGDGRGLARRIPGVLGLTESAVSFAGLFGETEVLPTSRIQKIATGRMLASGRKLLRLEVVRFTRTGGDELELVLAPESAGAWRSHLGLWAVAERESTMDRVTPGRWAQAAGPAAAGGQIRTSRDAAKCVSAAGPARDRPAASATSRRETSTRAGCNGHGTWSISTRETLDRRTV